MDERYGPEASQGVLDVQWIRDASSQGDVLLAKDKAMAKKPLEAEALYYNESRLFVVASAHVTGLQMLERFVTNSAAIERMVARNGPYVFGVYEDSISRIRLNFP
jgi:hypothetical protein